MQIMWVTDIFMPGKWIADKAMDWLFWDKEKLNNPETQEKIKENTEQRHNFLWEFFESFISRKFPTVSRLLDVWSAAWLKEKDPELYSLQNEFETLTALSTFVPNSLLSKFTDPIMKQPWFETIVKLYPLDGNIEQKILKDKNPQAVVDFVRMVHQDIVAVLSWKKGIWDVLWLTKKTA